MFDPKVIVALDYDNDAAALDFVSRIDPSSCNLKVGKELFTVAGPQFVSKLVALNFRVFLDLKFHESTPSKSSIRCHRRCHVHC